PRSLTRRGCERAVPPSARPAAGDDDACAGRDQVRDQAVVLQDLGADRQTDLDVSAVGSVLAAPSARLAMRRPEHALRAKCGEVAEVGVGDEHDVAPSAPVAAVWPSFGNELLPPEAQPAVSAPPRLDLDPRPIVEHLSPEQ